MIQTILYKSPVGELILGSFAGKLCLCDWRYRAKREEVDRRILAGLGAAGTPEFFSPAEGKRDPVLDRSIQELEEYFRGERIGFSVPLLPVGSDFQKQVWDTLLTIPFGATVSYGELARRMGQPEAVRGVAAANGANALSIFIPCHRVVGADGSLTGYAGGLWAKRKLLDLENPRRDGQLGLFESE